MKKIILVISIIIGFLELCVIVAYFCLFHGGISTNPQDWDIFVQIFNGMIMAILTAVNIFIFYQLTVAIEDRNQKRAIKSKLFEAQTIITGLRVKQYEEIRGIIHQIKIGLKDKQISQENFDILVKNIDSIAISFLFKDIDGGDAMLLNREDLLTELCRYKKYKDNEQQLIASLNSILVVLEIFMVRQLIVGRDITEYIDRNKDEIDSSICYIVNYIDDLKQNIFQDISKRRYFDLESLTDEKERLEYIFKTLKKDK